jgi:hypothetical protein
MTFKAKERPWLSKLLGHLVANNQTRIFLWLMRYCNFLLKYPKIFDAERHAYFKLTVIRTATFASLYFDNADFYLIAFNANTSDDTDSKIRTTFNLFLHFEDDFSRIQKPPYSVFNILMRRHPQISSAYTRLYLNKILHFSNYSRNKKPMSLYFKYLFDIAIKHNIIDSVKVSEYIWVAVTNNKEHIFDILDNDGYIYDLPLDEDSDMHFITSLLKLKGKSPYDYMTYCNPHYQQLCMQLIMSQ